jgi:hypothetical protein
VAPDWPRAARRRLGVALVAALQVLSGAASAADSDRAVLHADFERPLDPAWRERGFPRISRHNVFRIAPDVDGNRYLRVESERASSGMGVTLDNLDPRRCADLAWRWRVEGVVAAADLTRRAGDDAAAKLCVVFDGPSFWNPTDKRVLVYVWDAALPRRTILPNAWLPETARMVVLRGAGDRAGRWVAERVDLLGDFARAFPGETPGAMEAVAFLADTDDTGSRVAAGLDDLILRCAQPPALARQPDAAEARER